MTDLVEYFATSPAASLAMEMTDLAERRLVLLVDSLAVSPSVILRKVRLVSRRWLKTRPDWRRCLGGLALSREGRGVREFHVESTE